MVDENKNPWKTVKSEVTYDNSWIKVTENKTINAAGGDGIYGVVQNTVQRQDHSAMRHRHR